jgi:hypothetical protein
LARDSRGRFLRGHDADRHRFTAAERSQGWQTTFHKLMLYEPWCLLWFAKKVRSTARDRRRQ